MLAGLGIDGIGKSQAQKAIDQIGFEKLVAREFTRGDMPAGFGDTLTKKLMDGLVEYASTINELTSILKIEEGRVDGPLRGLKFVFTGALSDMSRDDAQERVRLLGGLTPGGVTKDLSYLVVGENADPSQTTKRDKAQSYIAKGAKIKIINETEFLELLLEVAE